MRYRHLLLYEKFRSKPSSAIWKVRFHGFTAPVTTGSHTVFISNISLLTTKKDPDIYRYQQLFKKQFHLLYKFSARDVSRIHKLILKPGPIIGQNLEAFESVRDRRSVIKLLCHGQLIIPTLLHTSDPAELLLTAINNSGNHSHRSL